MATKHGFRPVLPDEERALRALAASRTQPIRLVQRAKPLVTLLDEPTVSASVAGRRAGLSGQSGCACIKRFNEGGLAELADAPRGGRRPTHVPRCGAASSAWRRRNHAAWGSRSSP